MADVQDLILKLGDERIVGAYSLSADGQPSICPNPVRDGIPPSPPVGVEPKLWARGRLGPLATVYSTLLLV
jgi:hypothetical protein